MTQHLDMLRAIAERTRIPIVADVDTGYGNAVNVSRTVEQYARAGAAAVVIEDKVFPKVTSLAAGTRQELVRVEEFEGKIAAALDARADGELLVIARTEALIAGAGIAEALDRARAYANAGADMILVHSKQRTPAEIEQFAKVWDCHQKLVIVPTSYPEMDVKRIERWPCIGMVIYGNHAIRAAVAGMRSAFAAIATDGSTMSVETSIASVDDIFELQRMHRVRRLEQQFLR
jgi:phosphoenolpyruvate phosphomutase